MDAFIIVMIIVVLLARLVPRYPKVVIIASVLLLPFILYGIFYFVALLTSGNPLLVFGSIITVILSILFLYFVGKAYSNL